ncbi:hydrogenase maturation protease [Haloarcula halophila]|uniref:hydrogenase maturation protease n=1 Tax=Haloarcula TaxID=2237 RepID=UPI0023E402EF|nr:hydrogenase maturation protease [Halomicroarcula sp. DFY41]
MTGVAVGVGNPTMGDDGLGRAVVRALAERRPGLDATFAGTTAMLALEAMDGRPRGVVVDAVDADCPPGTVVRTRLEDGEAPTEVAMHDFTFAEAVRTCSGVYDLPPRVVVVGVVPATVEPTVGLSPTVAPVVPDAAAVAAAELTDNRHDGTDRFMDATWYCVDCEAEIDADAVDDHELDGHSVRGRLRPERLLSQDPWQGEASADGGEP